VRIGGVLTTAVLLLSTAACTSDDPPEPRPAPQVRPASLAGGACLLIDFGTLERILGEHYTIAASAKNTTTNTCVVRTESAPVPEIALSVTPTQADAAVFAAVVKPKGAAAVAGLGKTGYQTTTPAKPPAGPLLEVGWLTGNARLLFLRWTMSAGSDPATAGPKLIELAKELDKSSL
jgi:hypothetical protein